MQVVVVVVTNGVVVVLELVFADLLVFFRARPFQGSCWPLAISGPSSSCPLPPRNLPIGAATTKTKETPAKRAFFAVESFIFDRR